MSLKALHIVFVCAVTLLCFFVGWWGIQEYVREKSILRLAFGVGSILGGIGMIFYGKAVLRKLRDIGFI